uniref:Uncharacterized protein n=1 Tax=Compsopogon caeruleus TaxID=31354 RepID=A0A7S1THV6_9RHOD|mmetsp:Transcript_8448/g.17159  ORF Transcript_8448/g.17159 Transcript_8448/m.17159 type:complete len:167 (+) Transcript_8448:66-566(+)
MVDTVMMEMMDLTDMRLDLSSMMEEELWDSPVVGFGDGRTNVQAGRKAQLWGPDTEFTMLQQSPSFRHLEIGGDTGPIQIRSDASSTLGAENNSEPDKWMVSLGTTTNGETLCSQTMFNTMMNRSNRIRQDVLFEANRESAWTGAQSPVLHTRRIKFSDRLETKYG